MTWNSIFLAWPVCCVIFPRSPWVGFFILSFLFLCTFFCVSSCAKQVYAEPVFPAKVPCRYLCCFPTVGVECAVWSCRDVFSQTMLDLWPPPSLTASLLARTPGKQWRYLWPHDFIPKPAAQCAKLGVLSQEEWRTCPLVCSRPLGKIQGFSLIHSLMTGNLSTEVFCSISILLLQLISIFSKIRHCLKIVLQQIPTGLDSSTTAWLKFVGCCSRTGMDLGAEILLGPAPIPSLVILKGAQMGMILIF